VGQQGSITRMWAPKGSRPRAIRQQQFEYAYDFIVLLKTYYFTIFISFIFENGIKCSIMPSDESSQHTVVVKDKLRLE
jgi:hypothetical protein